MKNNERPPQKRGSQFVEKVSMIVRGQWYSASARLRIAEESVAKTKDRMCIYG